MSHATGRILDGHARVEEALEQGEEVPVTYLDLTEDEEMIMLATFDPIGAMATYDTTILDDLVSKMHTDNEHLNSLMSELVAHASSITDDALAGAGAPPPDPEDPSPPDHTHRLAVLDVSISEPRHQPHKGQTWKLGPHVLCVCDVMKDHTQWRPHLADGDWFVPYPGPFIALFVEDQPVRLVLVQPEPYIAGHILDKWESLYSAPELVAAAP